jgi:hypothetical protein
MKTSKPFQFTLASLFGLMALTAAAVWAFPLLPALNWSLLVPAGLLLYPFLALVAIDWIVERVNRKNR